MNNLPIVVYTHSDMQDVWEVFFSQLEKYMSEYKIYVFINKENDKLSKKYLQITYDDSQKYTNRIFECLNKINENVVLFFHEDMILYSEPNYEYIKKYHQYVLENKAHSIKLLFADNGIRGTISEFEKTLIQNDFSKFSVQPTIIKVDNFKSIVLKHLDLSIYELEEKVELNTLDFSATNGKEKKRGIFHYDSFVFPYIATAINKGKWNLTEYQNELNPLFEEYKINPFDRGIW